MAGRLANASLIGVRANVAAACADRWVGAGIAGRVRRRPPVWRAYLSGTPRSLLSEVVDTCSSNDVGRTVKILEIFNMCFSHTHVSISFHRRSQTSAAFSEMPKQLQGVLDMCGRLSDYLSPATCDAGYEPDGVLLSQANRLQLPLLRRRRRPLVRHWPPWPARGGGRTAAAASSASLSNLLRAGIPSSLFF